MQTASDLQTRPGWSKKRRIEQFAEKQRKEAEKKQQEEEKRRQAQAREQAKEEERKAQEQKKAEAAQKKQEEQQRKAEEAKKAQARVIWIHLMFVTFPLFLYACGCGRFEVWHVGE